MGIELVRETEDNCSRYAQSLEHSKADRASMTPDFLIVGAMKSGTTTLYRDLALHPEIFLPEEKEPEILVRSDDLEQIRTDYASLFRPARSGQKLGEASTSYTKRPQHENVAEKALAVCGSRLKIVYMHRDPLDRILSHYKHEAQAGLIHEDFAAAVRAHPRLIDYSLYDWQIEPWIKAFGLSNVMRLSLEDFASSRDIMLSNVSAHIGVSPDFSFQTGGKVHNSSEEVKTFRSKTVRDAHASGLYQRLIKTWLPTSLRQNVKRLLLRPKPEYPIHIDADTKSFIARELRRKSADISFLPMDWDQ